MKFLAKQNLAFRGHREQIGYRDENADASGGRLSRGNFSELAHLQAKYDPVLNKLLKKSLNSKITSSYFPMAG